jgi:hypothetical protein
MSDEDKKPESELTESQRKHGGWTQEAFDTYVRERNAAAERSLGDRLSNINPRTGRPRRTLKIEGAAYGWNAQDYWRRGGGNNGPRRRTWNSFKDFE